MAKKKWIMLPNGRIKRWKATKSKSDCCYIREVPPHWYRNHLNRRERRKSKAAIIHNRAERCFYIHPRCASWYW